MVFLGGRAVVLHRVGQAFIFKTETGRASSIPNPGPLNASYAAKCHCTQTPPTFRNPLFRLYPSCFRTTGFVLLWVS